MGWEDDYSGEEPISYNEVEKQINEMAEVLYHDIMLELERCFMLILKLNISLTSQRIVIQLKRDNTSQIQFIQA